MLHRTIGSLILVAGISYLLARASWQVVLLSFVVAGLGFASWRIRQAIVRRAKIQALWRRSLELDAMLQTAQGPQPYTVTHEEFQLSSAEPVAQSPSSDVSPVMESSTAVLKAVPPVSQSSQRNRRESYKNRLVALRGPARARRPVEQKVLMPSPAVNTSKGDVGSRDTYEPSLENTLPAFLSDRANERQSLSHGGRVYRFRMSDLGSLTTGDELANFALV